MLAKSEFADLVASIREQGLVHPVVLHEGRVLDGRNRLLACEEAGVPPRFVTWESNGRSPTEWVLATNLQRRHLTQSQRAAVAAKALPLLRAEAKERQRHHGGTAPGRRKSLSAGVREVKGKASERAAERFGVSSRYVEHATAVGKADPALLEQVAKGDLTVSEARQELRQRQRRSELRRIARANQGRNEGRFEVWEGDAESVAARLTDGSVDLVVTDPPYPKEYLGTYAKLARLAVRVLKDGGSLLTMAGQSYLPSVIDALRVEGLTYRWTLAYLTMQLPTQCWGAEVMSGWKPVLWFTKGHYSGGWLGDVVNVPRAERGLHKWEQSEPGMMELLKRVAKPGQLVLDPFCGSGTTGVAALSLGCRFIGIDIDAKAVKVARQRLLGAGPAVSPREPN